MIFSLLIYFFIFLLDVVTIQKIIKTQFIFNYLFSSNNMAKRTQKFQCNNLFSFLIKMFRWIVNVKEEYNSHGDHVHDALQHHSIS